MKKVLLVALSIFAGAIFRVSAQDMIMKKDGNEIRAKVIESDPANIKYKLYDNQGGPTYVIPKVELFRIKYEGGRIEMFTSPTEPPTSTTTGTSVTPQSPTNVQVAPVTQYPYHKIKREFLSGYGQYSQKPHFEIRPNGLAFVF